MMVGLVLMIATAAVLMGYAGWAARFCGGCQVSIPVRKVDAVIVGAGGAGLRRYDPAFRIGL